MPNFATSTVTAIRTERRGLQRVDTARGPAYVLTDLVGPVAVGDEVVLNTTAVDLGLGTGGWHVVHWNLSRRAWSHRGAGHQMKMRYTSLQSDTGAAEATCTLPDDLGGIPVVACTLHSQMAIVAATVRHLAPRRRIVYVMTDGAALPIVFSDLVFALRGAGALDATVTTGHAFGGDLEAVSVPSGLLLAAGQLEADVIVAAMGPGVVGTGSRYGTTAVEAASVLDATAALGGRAILCVRASDGDARPRHQGISHHVASVLSLCHCNPQVPVPVDLADAPAGATVVEGPPVGPILDAIGLRVTTMGRGPAEDPVFFAAASSAAAAANAVGAAS